MIRPSDWGGVFMAVKMLSVAVLSVVVAGSEALAQLGGPTNPPPPSFKGQQFVDSRGCLFLRAGFGNNVNWVTRLDRNHKPICGLVPTGSAAAQAAVAADMAPATTSSAPTVPAPAAPRKGFFAGLFGTAPNGPAPTAAAPTMMASAAPVARVAPTAPVTVQSGIASGVQCYPDAPKLERVKIADGTALVCTRGDGSTTGWRPPTFGSTGQAQMAAVTAPMMMTPLMAAPLEVMAPQAAVQPVRLASVQVTVALPAARPLAPAALSKPPKGWVYAWKDDRLNPLRGVGTAEGQEQQDLVWQRTVPMVLVSDPVPQRGLARVLGLKTSVSTMSAPDTPVPAASRSGGLIIQVGSFGNPANAQKVVARLTAMGLPVSVSSAGKVLQSVSAGPFASSAAAAAGLQSVHGAGFADAYLR